MARTATSRRAADPVRETRALQREEFGGLNWGAAFFGWLVAVGVATLLTAILSAAGAAIGLTKTSSSQAADSASTIGIVGGILFLAVLLVAYFAGGYVAGRMSRFDGPRQGAGVWVIGLLVTILLGVAGVLLGAKYNVLAQLNLPRIPVNEGALTTGGVIALVAVVLGTLLAAVIGGKAGTRYHRKIDKVGDNA
jgi:MFS family permease